MKAVSPKQEVRYVCESERDLPENEQTIFPYTPPTALEESILTDAMRGNEGMKIGNGSFMALQLCLNPVINLIGEDGKPVKFERDPKLPRLGNGEHPYSDETLSKIPFDVRIEVGAEIIESMTLKAGEAKNS
jgi:hypothetical protein